MVTENGNPYVAIQAPLIGYTTTGDSEDWIYGYSLFVKGYPTLALTVEACESFQPSASLLDQIIRENYKGFKVILQEAPNIRNNMIPYPIISQIVVGIITDLQYLPRGHTPELTPLGQITTTTPHITLPQSILTS
jgi:hypothetical protein